MHVIEGSIKQQQLIGLWEALVTDSIWPDSAA